MTDGQAIRRNNCGNRRRAPRLRHLAGRYRHPRGPCRQRAKDTRRRGGERHLHRNRAAGNDLGDGGQRSGRGQEAPPLEDGRRVEPTVDAERAAVTAAGGSARMGGAEMGSGGGEVLRRHRHAGGHTGGGGGRGRREGGRRHSRGGRQRWRLRRPASTRTSPSARNGWPGRRLSGRHVYFSRHDVLSEVKFSWWNTPSSGKLSATMDEVSESQTTTCMVIMGPPRRSTTCSRQPRSEVGALRGTYPPQWQCHPGCRSTPRWGCMNQLATVAEEPSATKTCRMRDSC